MNTNNHWFNGGTGLTNFDPEDFETYNEAIRLFNERYPENKDNFFIIKESMTDTYPGFYSLHRHDSEQTSLFWDIFDEVNVYMPTETCKMLTKLKLSDKTLP